MIIKRIHSIIEFTRQFIKKYWFIVIIILITIIRFLLSYNLPSFYLSNLRYDDKLMIDQLNSLKNGEYLGEYNDRTLVKGIAFPLFLYITNMLNTTYCMLLTLLYISACLFITFSLRKIVKSRFMLIAIYAFLALNPISYSSELLQRLYRNSLSIIELLYFFGAVINIISSKKNNIINYIFLGTIMSIMFLTREDNIWTIIVYIILLAYKLYKNFKFKSIFANLIPALVIALVLNIVSFINYKHYNIYTYNELSNSNFKRAYIKILQIKDDEKIDKVAITKSTLYKIAEKSKVLNFNKEYIDERYEKLAGENGEIYNGNIVWYLRFWAYKKNNFKNGEEANKYFYELGNELESFLEDGELEKENVIPSININTPTLNEIKELPKNLLKAIYYTTTYKNVKTFSLNDIKVSFKYNKEVGAYYISYRDYHNAENIIDNNPIEIEIIRNVYKFFTIILSIVALAIYIRHIKIKDKLNLILHIIVITYTIILCGVTYTHTTAFDAIRYCYLGNVYILQNLFIILNIVRIYKKRKEKNGISNNTSI